ncbi:MAG: AAA family ATPase [Clostridia bacterium]
MKENKDIIEDTLTKEIIDRIFPTIKERALEECSGIVKDLTKNITKVVVEEKQLPIQTTTQITHNKFKDLLLLISNNIPAMLTGGAGSGKSSTCEKVAKALGLDFYFSNAITQEYKLTGFIDANGKYQETQFYKAFKDGGLFVLDEIDASVPEALVILNTAIANGYFDFPNGKVQANEKFRIVACANTYGLGSDDVYVGRNQLDAASLDRFAIVKFDYDPVLEKNLAKDKEWVEFIQAFRNQIIKRKIKHIVSMRAVIYGDKLLSTGTDIEKVLNEIVFKNLELEDIKSIGKISGDKESKNKYIKTYNKIVER